MDSHTGMPSEPPDYYNDLGVSRDASRQEIRHAFARLAKIFHPDKTAPGQTIDAFQFRKIREAYEALADDAKRAEYDQRAAEYRSWRDSYDYWQRESARAQAEWERQAAEERAKWHQAQEQRRQQQQAAWEAHQRELQREAQARAAEHRAQEAARRQREQQEEAARRCREQQQQAERDRLRAQKEQEAEARSREAARRDQLEREKMAEERLRDTLLQEKQNTVSRNWARMRAAADARAGASASRATPSRAQGVGSTSTQTVTSVCDHPRLTWPRKTGGRNCVFCGTGRTVWSFRCPACDVAACPDCMGRYCA